MKESFILMGDIIKSSRADGKKLAIELKGIVKKINEIHNKKILSPLTITLGDEFQGVVKSLEAGISIIFAIEEYRITNAISFKLRFVLVKGKIETPVNRKIAYGMLGEGLTRARETLNYLKKSDDRFHFLTSENYNDLNLYFLLYQSFTDGWKPKDYKTVSDFFKTDDYKEVAAKQKKSVSQIWKRRKSLHIKEYKIIKQLIMERYGLV